MAPELGEQPGDGRAVGGPGRRVGHLVQRELEVRREEVAAHHVRGELDHLREQLGVEVSRAGARRGRLQRAGAPPPRSAPRASRRPPATAACTTGTWAGAARRRGGRAGAPRRATRPCRRARTGRGRASCAPAARRPGRQSRATSIISPATASRSSSRSGRHSATWRAFSAAASATASPAERAAATASRAERLRARAVLGVVELDGEPGHQARAQHGVPGELQRLLQPVDDQRVDFGDRDAQAGEAERRMGQQLGVRAPARDQRGGRERLARRGRLAGAQQRVAAREQHGAGIVLRARELERLQRPREALGGVLVGEPLQRPPPGARERVRRVPRVGRARGLEAGAWRSPRGGRPRRGPSAPRRPGGAAVRAAGR